MNPPMLAALGVLIWGGMLVMLLVSIAVQTDIERRWDEAWAIDWETRNGKPIDGMIDDLARQLAGFTSARRLLNLYVFIVVAALGGLAVAQFRLWLMPADAFAELLKFGLALLVLLFLPLRVGAEIGLWLVDGMYRQVRQAVGERLVITSKQELDKLPKAAR